MAAYDDAAGVTAEFNRNVLRVIDRRLGGDLDPERFAHVAVWDAEHEWIEMRLRSIGAQVGRIIALGLTVEFADGEEMRTEVSAKFRRPGVAAELAAAGFELQHWWTDAAGDFALSLSVARDDSRHSASSGARSGVGRAAMRIGGSMRWGSMARSRGSARCRRSSSTNRQRFGTLRTPIG